MVDAGILTSLPRNVAKTNCHRKFTWSGMLQLSKKHPRELLDINNSPVRVGINILYELNNSNFTATLQRSIQTAKKRIKELGENK